jgi:hypothetical protein
MYRRTCTAHEGNYHYEIVYKNIHEENVQNVRNAYEKDWLDGRRCTAYVRKLMKILRSVRSFKFRGIFQFQYPPPPTTTPTKICCLENLAV